MANESTRQGETTLNKLRRSYEACVLLVPLDERAIWLTREMASSGLDGVMTMRGRGNGYQLAPLASESWFPAGTTDTLDVVVEADITVLVVGELGQVDAALCRAVASEAEAAGTLLAALVIGQAQIDDPSADEAMVTLRQAVDMLVVVRSLRLATPFIDVLRGGPREPALAG
jgi:hypothetical protein